MNLPSWLMYALLSFFLWGFWGFFLKIAPRYIDPKSVIVFEVIGSIAVVIGTLFLLKFNVQTTQPGVWFAIAGGALATLGALFFVMALSKGPTSAVSMTSALYPLLTIALAGIILKEPITTKHAVGMAFATVAIILFAW